MSVGESSSVELARQAAAAYREGDVDWLLPRLAPALAGALDRERMRSALASAAEVFGNPVAISEPVAVGGPLSKQFTADVHGERLDSLLVVSFDDNNRISGFNVMPRVEHPHPSYAAVELEERAVSFAADPKFPIEGTLTLPTERGGPVPAMVCVHGSGPNDRDETAFGAKPFLDLALGLGAHGIAVLRYDKRTRLHGSAVGADVREEVIDDAVAAIDHLAALDGIGPVVVLGHSLGGTLAPAIASLHNRVAGIVVLAGATRPLRELVREQVQHLLATSEPTSGQREPLERLLAGLDGDGGMLGVPASYWDSLEAHSPQHFAPQLTVPVLVLQGERDYQVTMRDLDGWRTLLANHPPASFRTYPRLNHLFAAGDGPSGPAEYMRPNNVGEQVITDIATWIATTISPRPPLHNAGERTAAHE